MVHTGDTFTVYVLQNSVNGKRYVGCTRRPVNQRFGYGVNYKHNKTLNSEIEKYGWDSFTKEIISTNMDYETASSLEIELIHKYNSNDPVLGYNRRIGKGHGLYGYMHKRFSGGCTGKKHSEITKERMSMAHKGIKQSPEWVEARVAALRGRRPSDEKLKIMLPILAENSRRRMVPCKSIDSITGEEVYYSCVNEARKKTKVNVSVALRDGKTYKGLRFERVGKGEAS